MATKVQGFMGNEPIEVNFPVKLLSEDTPLDTGKRSFERA